MTEPMSAQRLDAIRARDYPPTATDAIIRDLLAEIDRLNLKVTRKHVAARRAEEALARTTGRQSL